MELTGGCQCGAVRYAVNGVPQHSLLCHCEGCRKSAGAPVVAWVSFMEADVAVTQGAPVTFNSTGSTVRSFCGHCGTGLFYRNAEFFPGTVDIQSATLDEPEQVPPDSQMQTAERLSWMKAAHELPAFDRFP
jgi:hypothetical protein